MPLPHLVRNNRFGCSRTLQQMIALDHVQFYNKDWKYHRSRISREPNTKEAACLDQAVLVRGHLDLKSPSTYHVPEGLLTISYICKHCDSMIKEDVQTILSRLSTAQRMKWTPE